jgi:hypothetical protein
MPRITPRMTVNRPMNGTIPQHESTSEATASEFVRLGA